MNKLKLGVVSLSIVISACSNAPTYNVPLKSVAQEKVSDYWEFSAPIDIKNTKTVSSASMGCRAVYLEGYGPTSPDSIDVRYTIDSKGKQRDLQIVGTQGNVDKKAVDWALTFGLSPVYKFTPAAGNSARVPVESIKTLYLVEDSGPCDSSK